MGMDVIDYEIRGAEMQFVEVELDPGEAAIGEAGSMMFMDAGIGMDTVFGDGRQNQGGGLLGKLAQGWHASRAALCFARLYLMPVIEQDLTPEVRLAPSW